MISYLQLMWVLVDVCGLFAINVVSFANKVSRDILLFANNLVSKSRCLRFLAIMFAGRYSYRAFKKTQTQKRADRIDALAKELRLPREALSDGVAVPDQLDESIDHVATFVDPDPFQEFTFQNPIAAKRAIADELGLPLAKLHYDQLDCINSILAETLNKQDVMNRVRQHIQRPKKGEQHAK